MQKHSYKNLSRWQNLLWCVWCVIALLSVIIIISQTSYNANLRILKSLARLVSLVSLATFIGTIFELRGWADFVKILLKPLIGYARLPKIAGASMVTAIFSNNAAGSLLASAFAEGRLTRFEMRVSAICNSYVAYVSHSLRVMYPIIGALGTVGLYYFGLMFGAGFIITLTAMTISRFRAATTTGSINKRSELKSGIDLPDTESSGSKNPITWHETIKKSGIRTREIVIRVVSVTIPLYILVSYLNKSGFFTLWRDFIPEIAAPFFPPEVLTIMAARIGGLISASGVASELSNQGAVSYAHILLALFAGNIITNPIRTLRRNLPSAMGIFPPRDGFFIVMVMQISRLLFALLFIFMLIVYLYISTF